MRVLAFEDHYDIEAMLVSSGVDTNSMTIEQRWNSQHALEHIERFKPEVLMLDHYMPPSTGFEVLEALLNSPLPRPSTIVAMSSDSERNKAMVALGADVGAVKFDIPQLPIWALKKNG